MTRSILLSGGCHCGAVRFECDAPRDWRPYSCNCSICRRSGYLHLIVPRAAFRLLQGQDDLTCYMFNTGTARHLFCRHCGVKSFYVPRSHPDGYSVNARCLDGVDADRLEPIPFDGENWETAAAGLDTWGGLAACRSGHPVLVTHQQQSGWRDQWLVTTLRV